MTRKEAIDKVYGMIGTAEQHEALDFLVPEIRELREFYDRQQEDERIRKEISNLYSDIDGCITELLKARTDKDSEAEGKALFKMEGIMVGTLQDLSCIEDYLEKQKEQEHICDSAQYEEGFKTGLEIGLRKQKEQKQEWSEKDSLHLKNAILSAEKEWGTESCTAKWLKSLPERFNLFPKLTWSEEERKILDSIIDDYEKAERSFCGYAGKIGFLRAIRDGEYGLLKQERKQQ